MSLTPGTELVSLIQAKQHVKAPLDVLLEDDSLYLLLEIAHGLVLDHVVSAADDTERTTMQATVDAWTIDTAPPQVKAAILEQFAALDADRGDPLRNAGDVQRYHSLTPRAAGFLIRLRDPLVR